MTLPINMWGAYNDGTVPFRSNEIARGVAENDENWIYICRLYDDETKRFKIEEIIGANECIE